MNAFCIRALTVAQVVWRGVVRRKDAYVLLILSASLLAGMMALDVFGLGGVTAYLKDTGLLLAWFFSWVLAVSVATRELPQEETSGTIFSLLAKPVRRLDLVVGKWLGAWTVVSAATLVFYLLAMVLVLLKGGAFRVAVTLQGFVMHAAALSCIAAMGVAFSTRMNHDAAASLTYVLTGAAFIVVPRVPALVVREGPFGGTLLLMLYNLLPHFEVFDLRRRMVHDYAPIDFPSLAAILAYGFGLSALFLLIAWMAYRNKRFSRGNLL